MAVDPYAGLSPEERKLWGLDGDKGAPGAAPSAPAPTTAAPAATPPAGSDAPATGILPALAGGVVHGAGDVVNAPMAWIGGPQFDAGGVYRTAQQQHPWAAGIGRVVGQVGGAGAAILGGEAVLPAELGAGALAARIATNPLLRAGVTGAIGGAEQNLLTAGEDPNESLWKRAGLGALTGGVAGAAIGKVGQAFGSGATLASPEVRQAAQTAQGAGINVGLPNLPMAGGAASAKGASATVPQAQQVTRAFGEILGQPISDLGPGSLDPMLNRLGQDVGNTAAQGHVDYNLIEPQLTQIENDYANSQYFPQIKRLLNNVVQKAGANNAISGADFQDLVRHNSVLDLATRNRNADIAGPAQEIEDALANGFRQSSPQGVADAYAEARGRYKLGLALEDNVKTSGVNGNTLVNPATILSTLRSNKWIPDISRLGAGNTTFDQVANLARASDTLFGGGAAQQAAREPLLKQLGVPVGIGSLGAAGSFALHNPVPAGLAGLYFLGSRGGQALGQMYQRSPQFVNRLISGAPSRANMLTPWAARAGVAALPDTINVYPPQGSGQ